MRDGGFGGIRELAGLVGSRHEEDHTASHRRCAEQRSPALELGLLRTGFTRRRGIEDDGGVVLNEGLQGFLVGIEWG